MGDNKKVTEADLVRAVTELYLAEQKDSTAAEIAQSLGCSVAVVRRLLEAAHGCPAGLRCDEEVRASYSKNYRMMQSGTHKVWVYGPTRKTLVAVIRELRGAKS